MAEKQAWNGTETPVLDEDKSSANTQAMGGLTIRELQMIPQLGELASLEVIEVGGTTRISEDVVASIAAKVANDVPGVSEVGVATLAGVLAERLGNAERTARGVSAEVGTKEAILDVKLKIVYGHSIPKTVVTVRYNIADRLLGLCGLVAKEINIRVVGLEFPDRVSSRVE